jgi:DNA polymerase-3 subunit beta
VDDQPLFRVHRSQIMPAIDAAFEAADTRAKIPILNNLLLRPDGDRLFIRGTNLDIEIEAACELLEECSSMSITVAATRLREIVRSLPEAAEIVFAPGKSEGQIRLSAAGSRFTISTLPERDFPSLGANVAGTSFVVDPQALSDAFRKVSYVVDSGDNVRIYLSGIHIHPNEDGSKLCVVAGSNRGLAVVRVNSRNKAEFPGIILSLDTAAAIRKLFAEAKEPLTLTISEIKIKIECGDVTIVSRLIDGIFPREYLNLVPKDVTRRVLASVDAMQTSIRRAALVAADYTKDGMLLTVEPGRLRLEVASLQGESAIDYAPVELDGEPGLSMGFNAKTFLGTLAAVATQDVRIEFANPQQPIIFRLTDDRDEFFALSPMMARGAEA